MQRNRSAHTAYILLNRRDIVNSRKLCSNKNRKWFSHSDRLFSLLPLKNPLRKHTSFGKSLTAWRNLAATQIFLFLFRSSKCNAFFWWITYLQKKRKNRERISVTHCFLFSLKGLSLTIFNSAYPRLLVQGDANYPSMKEFYHIQSLALFTAAVFNCRKPMSSFPRSCYLRRI